MIKICIPELERKHNMLEIRIHAQQLINKENSKENLPHYTSSVYGRIYETTETTIPRCTSILKRNSISIKEP